MIVPETTFPEGVEVPARVMRAVEALARQRRYQSDDPLWDVISVSVEQPYDRVSLNRRFEIVRIPVRHWWVRADRDADKVFLATTLHGLWSVPDKGRSSFASGFRMSFGPIDNFKRERDFYIWAGI